MTTGYDNYEYTSLPINYRLRHYNIYKFDISDLKKPMMSEFISCIGQMRFQSGLVVVFNNNNRIIIFKILCWNSHSPVLISHEE
jgi:hypothetical protein